MLNSVIPCDLTKDQRAAIGAVLVQAREIVKRVSSVAYGELAIREFRRDLSKGTLNKYLTVADRAILQEVKRLEIVLTEGFFKMVHRIATKMINSGSIRGEVEDLTQEGLEMILLTMMGYNGEYDLTTYFWNIVLRHFMDMAKVAKHDVKKSSIGDRDLAAPKVEESDREYDGYEMDLLKNAMRCVRLTPLEKLTLQMVLDGYEEPYSEAARRVMNPDTGKPYSALSARKAHQTARAKVTSIYESLLVRAGKVAA
jgi:RNA polymerase sigma factor (sigma-70 family)